MKILGISGDPHGKLSQISTFKEYLKCLRKLEEQKDVDTVVILGDLFDTHAIIRSEILNLWIDYFNQITKPYILLVGNHDETAPGSRIHALTAFQRNPNITIIDKPTEINDILFLPYYDKISEFNAAVDASSAQYVICHQTIDGAKYDNGFYAPDGAPIQLLNKFKLVISGHIHTGQKIANVWYPGTPYSMNFNDAGADKGLWTFNLKTLEIDKINTHLPKYIISEFNDSESFVSWLMNQSSKDKYKIVLKINRAEMAALQESDNYRDIKKDYFITLSPQYTDHSQSEIKISDNLSPQNMLKKYIMEILHTNCDKTRLLNKSFKFLSKITSK